MFPATLFNMKTAAVFYVLPRFVLSQTNLVYNPTLPLTRPL